MKNLSTSFLTTILTKAVLNTNSKTSFISQKEKKIAPRFTIDYKMCMIILRKKKIVLFRGKKTHEIKQLKSVTNRIQQPMVERKHHSMSQ